VFGCRKIKNLYFFEVLLNPAPGLLATQLRQPFNEEGKHADFDMGLNPSRNPMVDRRHLDPGPLQGPEATLDDHESFITAGGIFQADAVIVGFEHPSAVILGRFPDRPAVDPD
jgi:hypothetical protein